MPSWNRQENQIRSSGKPTSICSMMTSAVSTVLHAQSFAVTGLRWEQCGYGDLD